MPIGSSKLGVLGAGLVPGGSVTFNTSGNWDIPPGVKKVSITGKGGSGNPGNSGNAGNPGNLGTGGGGGAGSNKPPIPGPQSTGAIGGGAWRGTCGNFTTNSTSGGTVTNSPGAGNSGGAGASGSSGQAGQAGQAGNSGQASSGLGNNFPGGAGGNAGAAGNAGNGGSGGNGGGGAPVNAGGSGGNGGGSGSAGAGPIPFTVSGNPLGTGSTGGAGGGGAGATNDGFSGVTLPGYIGRNPTNPNNDGFVAALGGKGGNTANYSVPISSCPSFLERRNFRTTPCPSPAFNNNLPTNATGGPGGGGYSQFQIGGGTAIGSNPNPNEAFNVVLRFAPSQPGVAIFTPYPLNDPASQALRSGGGGGAGGTPSPPQTGNGREVNAGSGGGGGGRGNAGNPGGAGGAGGTGAAANPTTFNCVTVTPGATVPITVGSPGGQVVISWNPQ